MLPTYVPTSYDVLYGHPPDAVITRVERQIAGRDLVRLGLVNFNSLKSAADLSPFEKVVFYEASTGEPSMEEHGFLRYTSLMFLRQKIRDEGVTATRGWMREKLGRNLYREWKCLEPYIGLREPTCGIGSSGLLKAFQASAAKQIEGRWELAK